jgi:Spy/CpxP family protein refolding chaperone
VENRTSGAVATLPRPAERIAIVSIVLVFLCGAFTGALVMSYIDHDIHHGQRDGKPTGISMREWKEKLSLSDEQSRQLKSVLDDFATLYDDLSADGKTRVLQILTPEQKLKYEQMMRDHRK